MKTDNERYQGYFDRIQEAIDNGETDTKLGMALARWKGHEIVIWRDGKWLFEGFVMYAKKMAEIFSAIDPTIPPDVRPHMLDPVQIAYFFGIPVEEFNCWPQRASSAEGAGRVTPGDDGEPPKEVGTAEAAEILGVSKDTVLKLKAAGLLEYRNTAPPGSSRPVYAFTLRSVMELRTGYERDQPMPRRPTEQGRRRASGRRTYKHLDLDD